MRLEEGRGGELLAVLLRCTVVISDLVMFLKTNSLESERAATQMRLLCAGRLKRLGLSDMFDSGASY